MCASGRAAALGETSQTLQFQFIRKLLLQRCMCEASKISPFMFFFSLQLGGNSFIQILYGTVWQLPKHQIFTHLLGPRCSHLSTFMVPTQPVLAGPPHFPFLLAQCIPTTLCPAPSSCHNCQAALVLPMEPKFRATAAPTRDQHLCCHCHRLGNIQEVTFHCVMFFSLRKIFLIVVRVLLHLLNLSGGNLTE